MMHEGFEAKWSKTPKTILTIKLIMNPVQGRPVHAYGEQVLTPSRQGKQAMPTMRIPVFFAKFI
eukprot:3863538-Amphidinium_carterae.1